MIKLQLPDKPIELTDELEDELVKEFKSNGTQVWRKKFIIESLLQMSNNKCAYSEQAINTESAYVEIEHFRHKNKYQDEVVKWGNLLPVCKKCNATKGDLDVCQFPIVNPLVDNPNDFLYVKCFRFYKKNEKGQNTIDAVALNDREHFVNPRSEIGFKIADALEAHFTLIKLADTIIKKRNAVNKIKNTLRDCGSKYVYSAVLSTFVLYELPVYKAIECFLKKEKLWDNELDSIKNELVAISLPE